MDLVAGNVGVENSQLGANPGSLTYYVTSGEWFNLFGLQLPYLQNGRNNSARVSKRTK